MTLLVSLLAVEKATKCASAKKTRNKCSPTDHTSLRSYCILFTGANLIHNSTFHVRLESYHTNLEEGVSKRLFIVSIFLPLQTALLCRFISPRPLSRLSPLGRWKMSHCTHGNAPLSLGMPCESRVRTCATPSSAVAARIINILNHSHVLFPLL